MNTKKILVTDQFTSEAIKALEQGLGCEVLRSQNHYPTTEELSGVSALLIRSRTKIDKKLLSQAGDLKLVVSATSGLDHIDSKECENFAVQFTNTPEANTQSAAELTLMLILQCLRRQNEVAETLQSKKWKDKITKGYELRGQSLGIIGLGRVGTSLAKILRPFDVELFAYDPYKEDSHFKENGVERMGMSELLRRVDILSLHVPLTQETKHMINGRNLCLMSSDSLVINTSRGAVINEGDLTVALEQGQIAGCGLDVFEVEPLSPTSRLRELPQAVLSPHIGAYTFDAFERASNIAVQKVINFFTK